MSARGVSGSWSAAGLVELGPQLELVERVIPHRLERRGERAEGVVTGAVEALPTLGTDGHEAGALEGVEVLGDGAKGDVSQRTVDLAGGSLCVPHEPQDLAAARGGKGGQRPGHVDVV